MIRWGESSWAAVPLRLVMGIVLAVSGYGKLTAMAGAIAFFAKQGFPVPVATAWFIALLEFFGGIALVAGLFVRYLGILYTIEFIVAALWVKFPGPGYGAARLDLMLIAAAAALFFIGAGPWSVDAVWLEKDRNNRASGIYPSKVSGISRCAAPGFTSLKLGWAAHKIEPGTDIRARVSNPRRDPERRFSSVVFSRRTNHRPRCDVAVAASVEEGVMDGENLKLFEPDVLLPESFWAAYPGTGSPPPELFLMLAVLEDAISCLRRNARRPSSVEFREAVDWILETDSTWPFSFESICGFLGMDANHIRDGLLHWRGKAKSVNHGVKQPPLVRAAQGRQDRESTAARRVNLDPNSL